MKEIATFLNRNQISFKRGKNQFRFYCNKNEQFFDIEIYTIESKINKIYYFNTIAKTKSILGIKKYIDELNKIIMNKFCIKNYVHNNK